MCQDEDKNKNEDENQSFGSFWNLCMTNEPILQCIIVLRAWFVRHRLYGFIQSEPKLSSSGSFWFSSWHMNNLLILSGNRIKYWCLVKASQSPFYFKICTLKRHSYAKKFSHERHTIGCVCTYLKFSFSASFHCFVEVFKLVRNL